MQPTGSLLACSRLAGISGPYLGHAGKRSQPWSPLINVVFPRTPVYARFRGWELHLRGRGREVFHSSF